MSSTIMQNLNQNFAFTSRNKEDKNNFGKGYIVLI
jgi:hypothetical protein